MEINARSGRKQCENTSESAFGALCASGGFLPAQQQLRLISCCTSSQNYFIYSEKICTMLHLCAAVNTEVGNAAQMQQPRDP